MTVNYPSTSSGSGLSVGVDIGGTNTKLGVVLNGCELVCQETALTAAMDQPNRVCDFIREATFGLLSRMGCAVVELEGIGIAVPGVLDYQHGVLMELSNLAQWTDFPLRDELSKRFSRNVVVINDASAAAYGEYAYRNKGDDSLALVTLGTGIGCGIVIHGQPLSGAHGCGGEIGHAVVDPTPEARMCGCGKQGHLEAYAGSSGVVTTTRQCLANARVSSSLSSLANHEFTPLAIAEHAERGDAIAMSAVLRTAEVLGIGITQLCHCVDPEVVLLGGAMTFGQTEKMVGREFLTQIQSTVRRYSLRQIGETVTIEFAKLGGNAGILGAAVFARQTNLEQANQCVV